MRILSYNILDGAVGRADPVAEVMQAQNADVIAIIEADDDSVIERIVKRLNMDHVIAAGHGHRIALLSRLTIVHTVNHALLHNDTPRCMLEALVRTPRGIELPIIALHATSGAFEENERIRLQEMGYVLRTTHAWRMNNVPHLILGDFNANSPVQKIDITKCKKKTQQAFSDNGNIIPRRVIENLLDHGCLDTLAAIHPEMASNQATFTTHEPGQRVDFIFAHGLQSNCIKAAWIEQDRLATFASDHYPVGAEIDV